eukprot:jgi/Psemu1/757/gm1.757_g
MEAKTFYSSVAARPPKANDATPTMTGILIPEDASAKHYHELKDRLETLGGSKYIPQVGPSIEHLIRLEQKDFAPTKPTPAEYSTMVTDPTTQTTQMVEVPGLKETLMDMYKEELLKKKADEWIQYQRDMEKVYRLALGQVDDGMKAKLKGLKSWRAIDGSKCIVHPVTNILRVIHKLLCTQQRNLDAASYVKMMKENLDIVKSLGGTLVCKATVLADNYALQQNNYPSTSVEALDMVVAFKDSKKSTWSRGNNLNNSATPTQGNRKKKDDSSDNQESSLFAQQGTNGTGNNLSTDQHSRQLLMTATTYMFLNIGMISEGNAEAISEDSTSTSSASTIDSDSDDDNSSSNDIPDLVPQTGQCDDNNDNTEEGSVNTDYHFSDDAEYLFTQSKSEGGVNPYWILLDSESSLNLIVIPELVTNIREAPNNGFMNIHCNSGVSRTNLIADLPGFGVVWFYEGGLANVLSLALVSDQYRVTMDTSIDNALYVHKDGGPRRFQRSNCNLYYCDIAKKAREMQEDLGFPTSQELIKMIGNNIIKDCPITRRDISIMMNIYGKHASILKGKSVRQQSPHTREDVTPIPDSILKAY